MTRSLVRDVFSPAALLRLLLPWAGVGAVFAAHPLLAAPASTPALIIALIVIIAIILVAAFGVVHEAEQLAHKLGDPYGTLILTLSVVIIEVVLIASVMLGPGDHPTIARDSVSAVMLIIMGLVIGTSLIVGGIRHPRARHRRTGSSQYLGMIALLVMMGFVLPSTLGTDGAYGPTAAIVVAVTTVLIYAFFLWRQMGAEADEFREPHDDGSTPPAAPSGISRAELLLRSGLLVATMIPIVLLGHELAGVLDQALPRWGVPTAISGVIIAFIVFTPETITMVRAAAGGEMQRVANLGLGAYVSTVGLTIPSVLVIGLVTGSPVVLAEPPAMLAVIIGTIVVTMISYLSPRTTPVHGALHLGLFAAYALVLLG